jgi:hypothetical protein
MGKQPDDSNTQAKQERDQKEKNLFIPTTSDRYQKGNTGGSRRL